MTRAVYLIGAPGTGKSTLMQHLLADWTPGPYERLTERELFGHYLLNSNLDLGVYLGHLRPEYPGTDALSLSVAPQALLWAETVLSSSVAWVFGEGVRLGHIAFLRALSVRTDLTVVYLMLSEEAAAARRAQRTEKPLTDRYCRVATGRAAKAVEACAEAGLRVVELDAGDAPETMALTLKGTLA